MVLLRIAKQYTHMGIKTSACGSVSPELQSRHSSTIPYVHRLTWQYFRKTEAPVKNKLDVASSLLLSKETFGVGCMPVLNVGERQILHRNILGVYRKATSTSIAIDPDLNHGYSDAVLLHAYGLRAPYAYVRFHRLRLSVRFFGKAPFQLVVLACSAAADKRSWIYALILDLEWISACDSTCSFNLKSGVHFVTSEPKRARTLIRKVCSGAEARSLSLAEFTPSIVRLQASYTCYCGRSFTSAPAFHAHRGIDHGEEDVTRRFCPASGVCPACTVCFSNGKLLSHHLRYNAGFV